jgi:hypothetical protein
MLGQLELLVGQYVLQLARKLRRILQKLAHLLLLQLMLGIVESLQLAGVSLANLGLLDFARQFCQGQLMVQGQYLVRLLLLLLKLLLLLVVVKFLVILLKLKEICLTIVTLLIRRNLTLCNKVSH